MGKRREIKILPVHRSFKINTLVEYIQYNTDSALKKGFDHETRWPTYLHWFLDFIHHFLFTSYIVYCCTFCTGLSYVWNTCLIRTYIVTGFLSTLFCPCGINVHF